MILVPLTVLAALRNIEQINPDGVAYIRIAEYYTRGQIDLAINGYWGPLLSFIIAIFLQLTENSQIAARAACGLAALIFLLGALRTFCAVGMAPVECLIGGIFIALVTTSWSASVIAPDLLLGGLLLMGLADTFAMNPEDRRAVAFRAGLFYGLAYLAKAAALPITVGLIVVLNGLRWVFGAYNLRSVLTASALSLSGLALASVPWIATISLHYRSPTFSTSGPINHAIVGPDSTDYRTGLHPINHTHQVPKAGRITSWEDPTSLLYKFWSPFYSGDYFRHQGRIIKNNLRRILSVLLHFDLLAIGLISSIGAFFINRSLNYPRGAEPGRLIAPSLVILVSIYLPVWASDIRYFFPCYPLLIAASFVFFRDLGRRLSESNLPMNWPKSHVAQVTAIWVVISSSFLPYATRQLGTAITGAYNDPAIVTAKLIAGRLVNVPVGGTASFDDAELAGLYAAFLAGRPWYGNRHNVTSVDDALSSGARYLIVKSITPLYKNLAEDGRVIELDTPTEGADGTKATYSVRLFEVLKPECGVGGGC